MPQAPDNKIPYNDPWDAQRASPRAPRARGSNQKGAPAPTPQSLGQEALIQRALEILENPARPQGGWWGRLWKAVVAVTFILLLALGAFACYQYNMEADRPVITKLSFSHYLPSQDATVPGRIYFKDRNGDVAYAEFEPVMGRFGPFEADPPKLTSSTEGFLDFRVYIYCQSQEEGGFKVTLFDRGGHSRSLIIGFRCER
jgi:hypothetical protein